LKGNRQRNKAKTKHNKKDKNKNNGPKQNKQKSNEKTHISCCKQVLVSRLILLALVIIGIASGGQLHL
jgi:hypothetical protein